MLEQKKAFYSFIQYVHSIERRECVNVGVLIVCPELNWVEFRITDNLERAAWFFGKDIGWNAERLLKSLAKFAKTLEKAKVSKTFLDKMFADFFIKTTAGKHIRMTKLKYTPMLYPELELEGFMRAFVGTPQ